MALKPNMVIQVGEKEFFVREVTDENVRLSKFEDGKPKKGRPSTKALEDLDAEEIGIFDTKAKVLRPLDWVPPEPEPEPEPQVKSDDPYAECHLTEPPFNGGTQSMDDNVFWGVGDPSDEVLAHIEKMQEFGNNTDWSFTTEDWIDD